MRLGVSMAELDMARLRELAAEFGYYPATTDDEHLEKLRADNERFDRMNAHDPQGLKWRKMGSIPHSRRQRQVVQDEGRGGPEYQMTRSTSGQ